MSKEEIKTLKERIEFLDNRIASLTASGKDDIALQMRDYAYCELSKFKTELMRKIINEIEKLMPIDWDLEKTHKIEGMRIVLSLLSDKPTEKTKS